MPLPVGTLNPELILKEGMPVAEEAITIIAFPSHFPKQLADTPVMSKSSFLTASMITGADF